jgi:hypothetical protein
MHACIISYQTHVENPELLHVCLLVTLQRGNTVLIAAAATAEDINEASVGTAVGIVKMLLENGANINMRNKKGQSALDVAKGQDVVTILQLAARSLEKYRDRYEIKQSDISNVLGTTGQVVFAVDVSNVSRPRVVIKFFRERADRDVSVAVLQLLDRKFVAQLVQLTYFEDVNVFDDHEKFPSNPFAYVMEAGKFFFY